MPSIANPRGGRRSHMDGQAFLALVFLIGSIIVLLGVTIAFLVNSSVDTSYGYANVEVAEAVATAGVEDALLQLDRNVCFPAGGTNPYTVAVGSNTATITVTQTAPSTCDAKITILSVATVTNRTRKVNVTLIPDPNTGQLQITSWQTIP